MRNNLEKEKKLEFSKKLIKDIRGLLWIVTIGGLLLAFYCIYRDFASSLPWVGAMVGLPWASHATVATAYMGKSKAENTSASGEGITFAAAAARDFIKDEEREFYNYAEEEEIYNYQKDNL